MNTEKNNKKKQINKSKRQIIINWVFPRAEMKVFASRCAVYIDKKRESVMKKDAKERRTMEERIFH